ncbi:MAG: BatA domain-containing protein [Pirellulales bacterium]|nr:BatA domain-containing protein [Pirellulales bacterium]
MLLAFGFTNLALLGWLAAAAVPVVIHLWNRRQYREMAWAAMEYLLAAVRQSRRRMRFEQWLLLLVRVAIVVVVVAAVAEPYVERSGLLLGPTGPRTHRVIVLDGSFSMAYTHEDTSRFDQAKALARQIVEASPQGDAFSLVLMAAPARAVVGTPALEPAEFLQELGSLAQPHATADLPATLALVKQVLDAARAEQPGLEHREVYFLTDLGRCGWAPEGDAQTAEVGRQMARALGDEAAVAIVDLGQPGRENSAVVSLASGTTMPTVAEPVHVQVGLKHFGHQARKAQTVELLVDGQRVAQKQVDLPVGSGVSVGFTHRFDTPGEHLIEARLADDHLTIDNHRWLALTVKPAIEVLCVDGRPSGKARDGAAGYLAVALAPESDSAGPRRVQVDVAPEAALLERNLDHYDCLFLCDVAQLTKAEARVLENYVRAGGGLVVFLGPQVKTARYNRTLGGSDGLLPAKLGRVLIKKEPGIDPKEYRHPIVAPFRGRERAGLLNTPIDKYVQLDVPADSTSQVVLATPRGDPLIVERSFGRGRVVLVATSADTSWTPMPMWPSYVPIVQEMLAFAAGGRLARKNVLVGQPIDSVVPRSVAGTTGRLTLPDGRTEPLPILAGDDLPRWQFTDTLQSGPYTARFGEGKGVRHHLGEAPSGPFRQMVPGTFSLGDPEVQILAVNVDPAESNLAKLSQQELRDEIWPGVAFDYQTTWHEPTAPEAVPVTRRGSLARGFLYLLLGLLLSETFLAWRFGHHTN